ncbi:hypothetical protein KM043_016358 [Ampulex compressa]|nr:hypothetical protein KM043_016358 [Ampulex compressa]
MRLVVVPFVCLLTAISAYKNPQYVDGRTTMVHLFEWKYKDIAEECEKFLGPKGYGGVQTSPPSENLELPSRPWYERYQPMSYKIITRSGNEEDFADMVKRCNKVGVRIYPDTVVNHMTANKSPAIGTGGSTAQTEAFSYSVPYSRQDFHQSCLIKNYQNATEVRDCELNGLHDLDQSKEHVRQEIVNYFNRLIDHGVAGLRIDAAKHMWPQDLEVIYDRLKNLDVKAGFPPNSRPFIYQEVIDLGGEAVKKQEYTKATVIEFQYGIDLGNMFRGHDKLARIESMSNVALWNLLPSSDVLTMVDNHDNQRGHGAGGASILTYKDGKAYKAAVGFALAFNYGWMRIMSSFDFSDPSQGPPADENENTLSPIITEDGQCANGWVCEHRWRPMYSMVAFRNLVADEPLKNWWTNGNNQIAFSRGSKGFVAINIESEDLSETLQTGLPAGIYCDVITGEPKGASCSGKTVVVNIDGTALIDIGANDEEAILAIHIAARL